jgi:hypothetical protein
MYELSSLKANTVKHVLRGHFWDKKKWLLKIRQVTS